MYINVYKILKYSFKFFSTVIGQTNVQHFFLSLMHIIYLYCFVLQKIIVPI